MGKFMKYETTAKKKKRPYKIHPVWRGIGCLFLLLVPVMSYAGSTLLVAANYRNGWVPTPSDLLVKPFGLPVSYAEMIVTVLLMFIGFGIFVVVYSAVYRFIGPPKYGPTDAPPIRPRKGYRQSKSR